MYLFGPGLLKSLGKGGSRDGARGNGSPNDNISYSQKQC